MENRWQSKKSTLGQDFESALKTVQRVNSKSLCQENEAVEASQSGAVSVFKMSRESFVKQGAAMDVAQPEAMKVYALIFQAFSLLIGFALKTSLPLLVLMQETASRYISQVKEAILEASPDAADFKWENFKSFPQIFAKSVNARMLLLLVPLSLLFLVRGLACSVEFIISKIMLRDVPVRLAKCFSCVTEK